MNTTLITIFGILFTFICTTLGASVVYFFKKDMSKNFNTFVLGFASGIMISASIWSLLLPAIEQSQNYGSFKFVPAVIGFLLGGIFLAVLDKIVPNFEPKDLKNANNQEQNAGYVRLFKLFVAITLHNIPEGLAVGFAFGVASVSGQMSAYLTALGLAIGIGVQNIPEGTAVSLPIKTLTKSRNKAFLYGSASGAVEPIMAVVGYFLASSIIAIQPWILAFSAGTMLFVVIEELIPEANLTDKSHYGTWGAMLGFALMMILDVVM